MPSSVHQWLLVWIARRMVRDGFVVSGFDGRAPRGMEWSSLPAPFSYGGIRADAWGQRRASKLLAFGEAKTFADIDNAHTRQQLKILGRIQMKGIHIPCPLYIAIPRSAVYELDNVLIDVGLLGARHIVRLHVPDVLLRDTVYEPNEDSRTSA